MESPIDFEHLQVFNPDLGEEVAEAMIASVWARARLLAPCLADEDVELTDDQLEIVRSVVRLIVLRWADTGSGAIQSRTAGDYSEAFASRTGGGSAGTFRPDEIRDLQAICATARRSAQRAYSFSVGADRPVIQHALWCVQSFGETLLCDCGAELSRDGQPLWRR